VDFAVAVAAVAAEAAVAAAAVTEAAAHRGAPAVIVEWNAIFSALAEERKRPLGPQQS
jgi:hypothetical protein